MVTGYSIKRTVEGIIKIIKVQNNITLIIGRCIQDKFILLNYPCGLRIGVTTWTKTLTQTVSF